MNKDFDTTRNIAAICESATIFMQVLFSLNTEKARSLLSKTIFINCSDLFVFYRIFIQRLLDFSLHHSVNEISIINQQLIATDLEDIVNGSEAYLIAEALLEIVENKDEATVQYWRRYLSGRVSCKLYRLFLNCVNTYFHQSIYN